MRRSQSFKNLLFPLMFYVLVIRILFWFPFFYRQLEDGDGNALLNELFFLYTYGSLIGHARECKSMMSKVMADFSLIQVERVWMWELWFFLFICLMLKQGEPSVMLGVLAWRNIVVLELGGACFHFWFGLIMLWSLLIIDSCLNFMAPGNPVKMAAVNIENSLPPTKKVEKLSYNLTALLPCLPVRNI